MMQPPITISDPRHPDMSPAAIDQRLRELAQIYKLGMSLRDAQWLGPVEAAPQNIGPLPLRNDDVSTDQLESHRLDRLGADR